MVTIRSRLEKNLGWIILIILAFACFLVIRPFISALLWAGILCFSIWPVYERLLVFLNHRRTLAALIMSMCLALTILAPFALIGFTVADQVGELKTAVDKWIDKGPPAPPQWLQKVPLVGKRAADNWQNVVQDKDKLQSIGRRLLERLLSLGLAIGAGVIHLTLSLVVCFFLFRNGTWAATQLQAAMMRIGGDRAERLLNHAGGTVRGVVYGVLGTALVQAALAGVGFAIAGVPGAAVLALITLFLSIIPLGPPLVALPAALWLANEGERGWAIFMMIWGFAVGSIDNFMKPFLISRGASAPFLLILFGVLGGAIAFGFIGVFLGPTFLAVGYRIFQEWLAQKSADNARARRPVPPVHFRTQITKP